MKSKPFSKRFSQKGKKPFRLVSFHVPTKRESAFIFSIFLILLTIFSIRNVYSPIPSFNDTQDYWQTNNFPNSAGEYSTSAFTVYNAGCVDTSGNSVAGTNCIQLKSTLLSAEAQLKTPIDIDTIANHELHIQFSYCFFSSPNNMNNRWGLYLSRNSTLPVSTSYDPEGDTQVSLVLSITDTGSGNVVGKVSMQKDTSKSVTPGNLGDSQSGTNFLSFFSTQAVGTCGGVPTTGISAFHLLLNFTSGKNSAQATSVLWGGAGVSATTSVSGSLFPWLQFQGQKFYVGFYQLLCSTCANIMVMGNIQLGQGAKVTRSEVALNTSPTLDTSGFFGSVIKFFLNGAVFIFKNFLLLIAFAISGIQVALNSIGNFFGLGNIGDEFINILNGVASFMINTLGGIINQMANAGTFVANFANAMFSALSPYWTRISNFAGAILGVLGFLGTVLNDLFSIGALSANALLFIDYSWGLYKVYEDGTEGFSQWLNFNEMFFFRLGKSMYFLIDEGWRVGLRIKNTVVNWI